MSDGAYAFPDLPLAPVDGGRTLLVEGANTDGVREFLLPAADPAADEGSVLVSTNTTGELLLEHRRDAGCDLGANGRVRIVDCVSFQQGRGIETRNVEGVSNPSDLTGIGMRTATFYQSLAAEGIDRVRLGFLSLSTVLVYCELRRASRFVHVLTGRIASTDGIGLLALDSRAHGEQAVGTVQQLCDGRIEVRSGDDGREIRVSGLPGQPEGWTTVD